MRNATWIRFGIVAALATVGGAGVFAVGCGGDDNSDNPTPGTDGGGDAIVTPTDSGRNADTSVVPKPDAGSHAKLILVHASPDVPAIRVCFGNGKDPTGSDSTIAQLPALPDTTNPGQPYPGVFPGTGGAFPDITDLKDVAITPIVVIASAIASETGNPDAAIETSCDKLVHLPGKTCTGAKCLPDTAFIALPTIAAGTFLHDNTYLLSAIGCLPTILDQSATPPKCGSDYDGGANITVSIATLDTAFVPPDGGFGAQFIHAASAVQGATYGSAPLAANGLVPGFIGAVPVVQPDAGLPDAGLDSGGSVDASLLDASLIDASVDATVDAGDAAALDSGPSVPVQLTNQVFPIGPATKYANARTTTPTPAVAAFIQSNTDSPFGVFIPTADGGTPDWRPIQQGGNELAALRLKDIQTLTFGAPPPPSVFQPNETYTFVLLGDPNDPNQLPNPDGGAGANPSYDGHGVHFIAFPNHIVVKGLGQ